MRLILLYIVLNYKKKKKAYSFGICTHSGVIGISPVVCYCLYQTPTEAWAHIGGSESLNRNYSCSEVMERQIDKLWDAILTKYQISTCRLLNLTQNFLSVLWYKERKDYTEWRMPTVCWLVVSWAPLQQSICILRGAGGWWLLLLFHWLQYQLT